MTGPDAGRPLCRWCETRLIGEAPGQPRRWFDAGGEIRCPTRRFELYHEPLLEIRRGRRAS